tara:strand:+ start:397 stop:573 length:177 start_codon:yes stop_codon:yes gene_type:complete
MESDFNITRNEKELIIECLEKDIKRIEPNDTDNQMFIAWSESRIEDLQSLIKRIREDL